MTRRRKRPVHHRAAQRAADRALATVGDVDLTGAYPDAARMPCYHCRELRLTVVGRTAPATAPHAFTFPLGAVRVSVQIFIVCACGFQVQCAVSTHGQNEHLEPILATVRLPGG